MNDRQRTRLRKFYQREEMIVLIDGRVQQRHICVFKAQFVDSLSKGLQVGDYWDEDP